MAALDHRLLLANHFALINPLQVESALWRDLPATPIVPRDTRIQPDLMPHLLVLRGMSDATCVDLLERANRHEKYSRHPFFSALLTASADTPWVASHLSRRLVVRTPDTRAVLLRYFDARVFRHLRWLLTEAQINLLMGPIEFWTWRDTAGNWQRYRRGEALAVLSGLSLGSEQWGSLQRIGLINKCLRQIERHTPAVVLDDAIARRADTLLREAHDRCHLVDEADRCLYAEQGIRFHPRIHRHPQLVERLAHARNGKVGYVAACRDLDATILQRFATELTQPTRTMLT